MSASPKDAAHEPAHDLNGGAVQVAYDLLRETDEEGRARVQEALSERLSAGGLAVPLGGDS